MLENKENILESKGSSNRTFGFFFFVVFLMIAIYPLLVGKPPRIWSLAVAAIFLFFSFFFTYKLTTFNLLWQRFGLYLHMIVSPLALGVLFFLVVTPTALIMRLFKKDQLRLQILPFAETYWIKRDPSGPTPDSLNHQF